jgi:nitrogen-specific signal transduction histidine kinase/CheY-like chemotaxis protein
MIRKSGRKQRKPGAKGISKRKRTDIAKRRQAKNKTHLLHERLVLFSHFAAFSELTAWLAHEISQPLAAILGNAQAALRLMERDAPDLKELREIFADIISDDQRASEMIGSMRSKLKRSVTENKPLLLNDLIKEFMPIVQRDSLSKNMSIDLDLDSSLPSITGDRIQLQQVIFNLVVNALEAIDASERPGKLILRTRHSDREVVLDVVDSGNGIPNERLNLIFDPLVTTKADGLGMGLSLSRSIVISHNGRLWAENNSDGGATFHVAFPAGNSLALAQLTDMDRGSQNDSGRRSRGLTVLIADDGETFRHAVASILSELPELKHLAEAADGAEAIKMSAELIPDLILLDVGLPIVNGVEAAAKIRIVAPNAKLLFLTQHDSPGFVEAALRVGALGYVLKVDVGRELLQAAMAVVRGEQYLSSGVRR